jgi:hypothetical protein
VKTGMAVVLLLLGAVGAQALRAQPAALPCQTFTRASPAAPDVVRDWLAHSSDDHVIVCTAADVAQDALPLYTGESGVTKHGTLCSYSSHGLIRAGSGTASRLQRFERGEAISMALAGGECPAPHATATEQRYTTTYDLTPAAFMSIMQYWAAAVDSAQSFDRELVCCGAGDGSAAAAAGTALAAETRTRLRAAIAAGRIKAAGVTRIVRFSGRGLRRRYALTLPDPDSRPAGATVYVIYLSKWAAGPYHITGITHAAS